MQEKPADFRSIRTRFLLLTLTMVVILFGGLGVFIAVQNAAALRGSLNSKSNSVADLASHTGAEYLENFNFQALDRLVEDVAKDPEVSFAGFYNDKKELVTNKKFADATDGFKALDVPLKSSGDAVIGSFRIGYKKDVIQKSLTKSIFTVVAGTLAAIILFSLGISIATRRMILAPINRLREVIAVVTNGDLSQKIDITSNDELGLLSASLQGMVDNLNQMVRQVNSSADQLNAITENLSGAAGKVLNAASLQSEGVGSTSSAVSQINASIKGVNESVAGLSSFNAETSSSILEMTSSVEEVALNTEGLAQSVAEVSSSINQMAVSIRQVNGGVGTLLDAAETTTASVMQMDSSIKQVERNTADASAIAERVLQDAKNGRESIDESIAGIHEIRRSSEITFDAINALSKQASDIGSILTVIDEVAEQTNLLSLNAAIIAAQAGEHGKGFAVVADEIKGLAERTKSSTREIIQVVKAVQDETARAVSAIRTAEKSIDNGKELSEKSGMALLKIFEGVQRTTLQMQEIARATVEQSKGSQQIREAMSQISDMVRQIDIATKEQALGSEQIMSSSERMKEITFQVRNATHEQTNVGKLIACSTENITGMINRIGRACGEQARGSELIKDSVDDIQSSAAINLDASKTMDESVVKLFQQIELLRKEMNAFKV